MSGGGVGLKKGGLFLRRRARRVRSAVTREERARRPRAELINAESALGRTLFGPIPAGHQREFFQDRRNVWIFHEGWTEQGVARSMTVRYEVRRTGVFKRVGRGGYERVTGEELENFRRAAHAYLALIKQHLYHV